MPNPAPLVQAYVEAVKCRAIYVQAGPGGKFSRISFDAEKQYETAARFEFHKPSHAELVMLRCTDDFAAIGTMVSDGWVDLPPAEVKAKIIETADLLGAELHDGKATVQKAERMVAGITAKVEEMRKNGGLQEVNKKYKAYRLEQLAKGEKAVSYNAYLAKYKAMLVEHAARLDSGQVTIKKPEQDPARRPAPKGYGRRHIRPEPAWSEQTTAAHPLKWR